MESGNATSAFLGHESLWSSARVELSDVQGLWGGCRILAAGSGQVVVQAVQPGMYERRYEFKLNTREWKQILELFLEKDFLTIQPMERPGIPDEARPRIILVNAYGDQRIVSKWANVTEERFDAIYSALRRLETLTSNLTPIYSGPYRKG